MPTFLPSILPRCPQPLRSGKMWTRVRSQQLKVHRMLAGSHLFHRTCSGTIAVLQLTYSSLPSGKFEFHAEWLRDEPFDATTTGQNKGVPVSTLSWRQGT